MTQSVAAQSAQKTQSLRKMGLLRVLLVNQEQCLTMRGPSVVNFFKAIIFNSKGNFTLLMTPNFRTAVMILKQLFEFGASLGSFIKLESMSHKRQNEHKKSHDCCVSAFTLERFVASKLLRFLPTDWQ